MGLRLYGTYKNTNTTLTQWEITIYDNEYSDAPLEFVVGTEPTESCEGIPYDMPPGIYPSSFDFIMSIREGHESFVTDLFSGDEERFVAVVKRNGLRYFVGYILADQSSYLDEYYPYRLFIQCEDGLYKLNSEKYKPIAKELKYLSCAQVNFNSAIETGLIDFCVTPDVGWTPISHVSEIVEIDEFFSQTSSETTYARYEISADVSPGAGWIDLGNGIWAKAVTTENQTIINPDPNLYSIQWDIVKEEMRTIQEFIHSCIAGTGLADFFTGVMYDVWARWYELRMPNFTTNPFGMERVSEFPFKTFTLEEVLMEICRMHYLRVYSCDGRYHIECISERPRLADAHRWLYDSGGTYMGSETVDLDVDGNNNGVMRPLAGGKYKGLAPLRSVSVTYDVESGNILEGVTWTHDTQGTRFLGSIPQKGASHRCEITIATNSTSRFDQAAMTALFPQFRAELSRHYVVVTIRVRIVNRTNGNEYWIEQNAGEDEFSYDTVGTWGTDATAFIRRKVAVGFIPEFSHLILGISSGLNIKVSTGILPGSDGDIFDMYASVHYSPEFLSFLGGTYWLIQNPTKFTLEAISQENFFLSTGSGEGVEATRRYYIENTVKNTLNIDYKVLFCDSGGKDTSIEIYDGSKWVRSVSWARYGVGAGKELLALLVHQIMSMRQSPRLIHSAAWNSVFPTAQNRIYRGGKYFLPMRVSKNTNYDTFSGDFVEIAQDASVPDTNIILVGDAPQHDPPGATGDIGDPDVAPPETPPVLGTNDIIAASVEIDNIGITNTLGIHVETGTIIQIVDPDDYTVFESVILSQDLLPGDTTMYFEPHTFTNGFPADAIVVIEPASNFAGTIPAGTFERFYLYKGDFTGSELEVPNFKNFAQLETLGARAININFDVHRSNNKIVFFNSPDPNYNTYYFDYATNKFKFPIPLLNESIEIKAFYV